MLVRAVGQKQGPAFGRKQPQIFGRNFDQLLGGLGGQKLPEGPLNGRHLFRGHVEAEHLEQDAHRKLQNAAEDLFSEAVRHGLVELDLDGQDGVDVGRLEGRQQLLDVEQDGPLGRVAQELDEDRRVADEVGQLEVERSEESLDFRNVVLVDFREGLGRDVQVLLLDGADGLEQLSDVLKDFFVREEVAQRLDILLLQKSEEFNFRETALLAYWLPI